jgi:hypothetical protein
VGNLIDSVPAGYRYVIRFYLANREKYKEIRPHLVQEYGEDKVGIVESLSDINLKILQVIDESTRKPVSGRQGPATKRHLQLVKQKKNMKSLMLRDADLRIIRSKMIMVGHFIRDVKDYA